MKYQVIKIKYRGYMKVSNWYKYYTETINE